MADCTEKLDSIRLPDFDIDGLGSEAAVLAELWKEISQYAANNKDCQADCPKGDGVCTVAVIGLVARVVRRKGEDGHVEMEERPVELQEVTAQYKYIDKETGALTYGGAVKEHHDTGESLHSLRKHLGLWARAICKCVKPKAPPAK